MYFLSGALPLSASLDIQIFSLLARVARLGPENIIFKVAQFSLENPYTGSYFLMLRKLSLKYSLPDPVAFLLNPPSKAYWKGLVRSKVADFWHTKLCKIAESKSSLKYLKCEFLELGKSPHPLWESCQGSHFAIKIACVQAKMLSGNYRSDAVLSKFSKTDNPSCKLPGCSSPLSDVTHLLSGTCPPLKESLLQGLKRGLSYLSSFPHLLPPILSILQSFDTTAWVQMVLDPSVHWYFIQIRQHFGKSSLWPIFRFSRTVIWSVHKKRSDLLHLS